MIAWRPQIIPPVPMHFETTYITGGWRAVERQYGARTDIHLKWFEMSGGDALHEKRREYLRGSRTVLNTQRLAGHGI